MSSDLDIAILNVYVYIVVSLSGINGDTAHTHQNFFIHMYLTSI